MLLYPLDGGAYHAHSDWTWYAQYASCRLCCLHHTIFSNVYCTHIDVKSHWHRWLVEENLAGRRFFYIHFSDMFTPIFNYILVHVWQVGNEEPNYRITLPKLELFQLNFFLRVESIWLIFPFLIWKAIFAFTFIHNLHWWIDINNLWNFFRFLGLIIVLMIGIVILAVQVKFLYLQTGRYVERVFIFIHEKQLVTS